MGWLQRLFGDGPDWAELIETKKAQIVDVRSPGEYRSGHLKNSVNIPLSHLPPPSFPPFSPAIS